MKDFRHYHFILIRIYFFCLFELVVAFSYSLVSLLVVVVLGEVVHDGKDGVVCFHVFDRYRLDQDKGSGTFYHS